MVDSDTGSSRICRHKSFPLACFTRNTGAYWHRTIQNIFIAGLYACNRNSGNCLHGSSEKPGNDDEGCRLSRQADMERSYGSGYRSRYRIVHCLSVDRNGIESRRCTHVLDNRTNRTCKPKYSAGYATRHTRHGHSRSIDRRHNIQRLCISSFCPKNAQMGGNCGVFTNIRITAYPVLRSRNGDMDSVFRNGIGMALQQV